MMDSEQRSLNVPFVVGGLYTESSGIARILSDLANALGAKGWPISVYTARRAGASTADHLLQPPSACFSRPARWLGRLSYSPELAALLEKVIPKADVIHNHSMWMLPNAYASRIAAEHRKPVVFTSYGYLEAWALAHSRWKKRLAGWWFQDRDLHRAACLHVNSEGEIAGLRSYGLRNPVAVVPNGVHLGAFDSLPAPAAFRERIRLPDGRRIVLFLSRMHPKKGLSHLLTAWKQLHQQFPEWHLVLAGPDDGDETRTRQQVKDLDVEASVTFAGSLEGDVKLSALAAAELFVLPSFSEGFSMAVLEAMASRLPVLVTPGCHFPEVQDQAAGLEVSPTHEGVLEGLRVLMSCTEQERSEMGRRGRQLVESSYTWDHVADQMLDLYRWLAGRGPEPGFVERV